MGLILRLTPLGALGGVIAAGTAGLLAGALLAGGVGSIGGACVGGTTSAAPLETRSGPFSGPAASVTLDFTCTDLSVGRQDGGGWSVAADFSNDRGPRLDASPDRLSLRSPSGTFFFGTQTRRMVDLTLPTEQRLAVSLTLNASTAELDLGPGDLASLSATFNASDASVDLTEASASGGISLTLNASSGELRMPDSSLAANVTLNASSLELCSAPETGLQIRYSDTLSSANLEEAGLTRSGNVWRTAGYEAASVRHDLGISANVSSLRVERTGGCP
ncbi:MAG TPA: hypothetical protein VMP67_03350 [Candidatus Limnocylindria bacterium]|nr:hypothetical protein [Candidatus Limnocylindria bacterium]